MKAFNLSKIKKASFGDLYIYEPDPEYAKEIDETFALWNALKEKWGADVVAGRLSKITKHDFVDDASAMIWGMRQVGEKLENGEYIEEDSFFKE